MRGKLPCYLQHVMNEAMTQAMIITCIYSKVNILHKQIVFKGHHESEQCLLLSGSVYSKYSCF